MFSTNHKDRNTTEVFKALLFLSAGSVIHAITDEQDMRHSFGF